MIKTISTPQLSVSVKDAGAELCSIKGPGGMEYLWQADPAVWGRHAPILFPIVGKLVKDRYLHEGKSYEMKQHGFARDKQFELIEATEASLSYRLQADSDTLRHYPFNFSLVRHYRLTSNTVAIVPEVTNTGAGVMPFSIGEHPGFALNWGATDKVADYALQFEKAERLNIVLLNEDHLLSAKTERLLTNERVLPLRNDLFDRDALIFLKIRSRAVALCSRRHSRRLTVEFPEYPCLGIWAKPGAPFVCIEPWFGHADTESHNGQLEHKAGIIKLDPGQSFSCVWRAVVEE